VSTRRESSIPLSGDKVQTFLEHHCVLSVLATSILSAFDDDDDASALASTVRCNAIHLWELSEIVQPVVSCLQMPLLLCAFLSKSHASVYVQLFQMVLEQIDS